MIAPFRPKDRDRAKARGLLRAVTVRNSSPARILVLRTSRYLELALRSVDERWPGADVAIVTQPSAERGSDGRQRFIFESRWFRPIAWWRSPVSAAVAAWRPGEVVVQLPMASPIRSWSLSVLALLLSPTGFWFVLPSGELGRMTKRDFARHAAMRAARPVIAAAAIAGVVIGTIVAYPGYVLAVRREGRA